MGCGAVRLLALGTDFDESVWLFDQQWDPRIHLTAGTHPHYASQFRGPEAFHTLWQDPRCVAVGECGLDYYRMLSPAKIQQSVCAAHMQAALALDKPIYLHDRQASDDLYDLMRAHDGLHGVVHCFTGDRNALRRYLDHGLFIGLTGWCLDERRGQALAELVPYIPSDRLLIETDSPYLVPRNIKPRPKRNEPALLRFIAQGIAQLRGETPEQIMMTTAENARRMLRLDLR